MSHLSILFSLVVSSLHILGILSAIHAVERLAQIPPYSLITKYNC